MTEQQNNIASQETLRLPEKTRRTAISKVEIGRLADIARQEQVVIELEVDGRLIRMSPFQANDNGSNSVAKRGGVVL